LLRSRMGGKSIHCSKRLQRGKPWWNTIRRGKTIVAHVSANKKNN